MTKIILMMLLNCICFSVALSQNVNCQLTQHKNINNSVDPILKSVCTYQKIMVKKVGEADYKGRYSWEYELSLKTGSTEAPLTLAEVFGSNANQANSFLNKQLKEEYESNLKDPDLVECMANIAVRHYELDEFQLDFSQGKMVLFWVEYNTGGACYNMNLGLAKMTWAQFDLLAEINR